MNFKNLAFLIAGLLGSSLAYADVTPIPPGNMSSWPGIINNNFSYVETQIGSSTDLVRVKQVAPVCDGDVCDPNESGTELIDAVNSVSSSNTNPWLIEVQPGTYNVGDDLHLQPGMHLIGSGRDVTTISAGVLTLPDGDIGLSNLTFSGEILIPEDSTGNLNINNINAFNDSTGKVLSQSSGARNYLLIENSDIENIGYSTPTPAINLQGSFADNSVIRNNTITGSLSSTCDNPGVATAINIVNDGINRQSGLSITNNIIHGGVEFSGNSDPTYAPLAFNNPGRVFIGNQTQADASNMQQSALSAASDSENQGGFGAATEACTANLPTRCGGNASGAPNNQNFWGISYGCVSTGSFDVSYPQSCQGMSPNTLLNYQPGQSPSAASLSSSRSVTGLMCITS